jgi:DNA-binding NarL/FixJ family response regulator
MGTGLESTKGASVIFRIGPNGIQGCNYIEMHEMRTGKGEGAALRMRVLLADDHEWVLQEMEYLLASDFEVVGKVTDGIAMVEAASRLQPDLIVTDLAMPGMTGIEASREALKARPGVPIVLLTMHSERQFVEDALSIGVRGYVHKLAAGDELIPAMRCALKGQTFVSPVFRNSRTN